MMTTRRLDDSTTRRPDYADSSRVRVRVRGRVRRRPAALLAVLIAASALCGCTSTYMKGTPFYTAEGEALKESERIPLWPIVYYEKDKILSILWPFMEFSDDHVAVRPLASVHGLEDDAPVYNVLWPMARFNPGRREHHIFPAFWGKRYFTLFPLYWHRSWDRGYSDTLFPLWSHRKDTRGWRTHVLWPFMQFKNRSGESGFHMWPLTGYYSQKDNDHYGFLLWPLGHSWAQNRQRTRGNTFFPLYYYEKDSHRSTFLTIPYSQGSSHNGSEKWNLLFPLFYREKTPKESTFLSLPWSASSRKDGSSWQCVPPLYHYAEDSQRTRFISPLYSRGAQRDGSSSWSMLLPLYYGETSRDGHVYGSLLGGISRSGDTAKWLALPLLSGGTSAPGKNSHWILGPLAHTSRDDARDERTHYVFPLYASTRNRNGSVFMSLPWSSGTGPGGRSWQVIPGLYGRFKDADSQSLITPLYAAGKSAEDHSRWHVVAPLYYRRRAGDGESMLATLLGGYEKDAQGRRWLVYPLLSWGKRSADGGEVWAGAPLFHARWDQQGVSHHVLPLYYWNGRNDTLVSPLAARWQHEDGRKTTLVPPALSWLTTGKKQNDLWLGGPLVHWSWGEEAGPRHILPLMYANPRNKTFASPVLARWGTDDRRTTLIPPALSWKTTTDRRSDLWLGGPLAHFSWGERAGESHVLPLYYSDRKAGTFVSLPYASWRQGKTRTRMVPPALSWVSKSDKRSDLWLAGPLAHYSWGEKPGPRHVFPIFYDNRKEETFLSLPYATWKDGKTRTHLCPPTLSWYSSDGRNKEFNGLLGLMNEQWGTNQERSGHFIPLYWYEGTRRFYSLLAGWNRDEKNGFVYPLTPLAGFHTGEHRGGWLFPLFTHKRDKGTDRYRGSLLWGPYWGDGDKGGSHLFPLYHYRNRGKVANWSPKPGRSTRAGKSLWVFPTFWYRNSQQANPDYAAYRKGDKTRLVTSHNKRNTLFPLWNYSRETVVEKNRENVDGSLLWFLYTYEREVKPATAGSEATTDDVRARVLWKLWDYQRKDKEVRVDIFPGITYDREKDGSKEVTFLLRFFRYKRNPEGLKLDLLFIPLIRTKGSSTRTSTTEGIAPLDGEA